MRILVACEESGVVTAAFRAAGHTAYSCDILPTRGNPKWHYQCDVRDVLYERWDMLIAFPPCTYLCVSGLHWNGRVRGREKLTRDAVKFVAELWNAPIKRVCIENPTGCINTRLPYMPLPQYIQPYDFGHNASKRTGLWLRELPPLKRTRHVHGRLVRWNGKRVERWANQSNSGQNDHPENAARAMDRSTTFSGVGRAMATQWVKRKTA